MSQPQKTRPRASTPPAMRALKVRERSDPFADIGSRLVFEFGGTFFLCLAYALADPASRPAAMACAALAVAYAGAHVSGAHCNPAVSMAVWLAARQEFNTACLAVYFGTQIVAAVCAGAVAQKLVLYEAGTAGSTCAAPWPALPAEACRKVSDCTPCAGFELGGTNGQADCASAGGDCAYTAAVDSGVATAAESIGVFVLCFVLLHTTTTRATANNSYFGVAIGFGVLSAMTTFDGLSGGAFNPAISIIYWTFPDSTTLPSGDGGHFWLAGLIGAASAAFLFRLTAQPAEFRHHSAPLTTAYHRGVGAKISTTMGHHFMELVGTMYLAVVVSALRATTGTNGSNAAPSTAPLAALTLGAAYTAWVCTGGAISGGLYSPSLSLALVFRHIPTHHGLSVLKGIVYISMQFAGGILGGMMAKFLGLSGCLVPPSAAYVDGVMTVWAAEALGSGLLTFMVCHVATLESTSGNSFFGMTHGFT